ncbi:uncharacterized protein KGF55_004410 [Candida pseudojiufengensis]|uniref:uncharacterized protein n=1 Tax=Candida pseudojiufengensis TaxID=497109 RepID=UPI002223EF3D|nr:uncharacterized protein KGF55_004410 [Candida pseudojiufengensis]KAI5960840.1 hypothetical protein KGF55_004410 [Candida pseudojiufengensis]
MSSTSDSTPEFLSVELSHSTPIEPHIPQTNKNLKNYSTLDPKYNQSYSSEIEYGRNLTDSPNQNQTDSILLNIDTNELTDCLISPDLKALNNNTGNNYEFISSLDLQNLGDNYDENKSEITSVNNVLKFLGNSTGLKRSITKEYNTFDDYIVNMFSEDNNNNRDEKFIDFVNDAFNDLLDFESTIQDLNSKIKLDSIELETISIQLNSINSKILKIQDQHFPITKIEKPILDHNLSSQDSVEC